MLHFLKFLIFIVFTDLSYVYAQLPSQVENSLKKNHISSDNLSLTAFVLNDPNIGFFHNNRKSFIPASIMKLVTTYAALELLGPNFRWYTSIYTDGEISDGVLNGNLYIKGGGDPKLTLEKVWSMLKELKLQGIDHVKGDLILDDTYFNMPNWTPFYDDSGQLDRPFLVTPHSLMTNFNVVRIHVRNDNGEIKIQTDPDLYFKIINNVTSSSGKKCAKNPYLSYNVINDKTTSIKVSGKLNINCSTDKYLSVMDHLSFFGNLFKDMWKKNFNGSISGNIYVNTIPSKIKFLFSYPSSELSEVVRDINKYSSNPIAKQVFLTIGRKYRKLDDVDDGTSAIHAILKFLITKKIDMSELNIENGSGLTRNARLSSDGLALMLKDAFFSKYSAEFLSSLPIIGYDGTMKDRLRKTRAYKEGRIKTGSLKDVRSIAGFINDSKNRVWVVVAIINSKNLTNGNDVLDDILLTINRM